MLWLIINAKAWQKELHNKHTLLITNLIVHRSFYTNKDPDKLHSNNYTNTVSDTFIAMITHQNVGLILAVRVSFQEFMVLTEDTTQVLWKPYAEIEFGQDFVAIISDKVP